MFQRKTISKWKQDMSSWEKWKKCYYVASEALNGCMAKETSAVHNKKQKKSEYDDSISQCTVKRCSDKNCQENKNNVIWSVTNTDVQLPKPVIRM